MIVRANLADVELHEGWWESDPERLHAHFAFPLFWATGNASTSVLYVELDPGCGNGRHTDTPEELLLVLEGEVEVELGDEKVTVGPGEIALIPSMVPHRFENVGSTKARVIGFFSSNVVIAEFEESVQPIGRTTVGTPTPEMVRG